MAAVTSLLLVACGHAPGVGQEPEAGTPDAGHGERDASATSPDTASAAPDAAPPGRVAARAPLPPRAATHTCLAGGQLPARLSESGCFVDLPRESLSPDLVPFEVVAPLWTDGAHKQRWLALPPGSHATVTDGGALGLPVGSVLVKRFAYRGADGVERPVEHRLMLRTSEGWLFAGYRWNEAGTDAERVERSQLRRIATGLPEAPELDYLYPGPLECVTCHSPGVEQVFGPHVLQLSRRFDYGGDVHDQLAELARIQVLAPEVDLARVLPAQGMVDPADRSAPLEQRARSWLHANCSHCHQPGGWTPPGMTMDLRFGTPLADAGLCDVETQYLIRLPRVRPGDPEGSALWRRISSTGLDRMPPVGLSIRDPLADVVREWIAGLPGCPPRAR